MVKVVYPITWLAGREGEAADVIHDIAVEMMEHRANLFRHSEKKSKGEGQNYRRQANLFEEYATVLDAIYFQLEPERWDPETSGEVLELAQLHHIALPDWMLPDRMKPGKTRNDEYIKETTEDAVGRFENEGGRI
jgi:stalled ribosome alternative rescue factor ArfA